MADPDDHLAYDLHVLLDLCSIGVLLVVAVVVGCGVEHIGWKHLSHVAVQLTSGRDVKTDCTVSLRIMIYESEKLDLLVQEVNVLCVLFYCQ